MEVMMMNSIDTIAAVGTGDDSFWERKSMLKYRIPLELVDSTTYVARGNVEKYVQLERIIEDNEQLKDLKEIANYFPRLAQLCLEQGTRNVLDIDDVDDPLRSDSVIRLIARHDLDPGFVFSVAVMQKRYEDAGEIFQNFYMFNEEMLVRDALAVLEGDEGATGLRKVLASRK